MKKKFNILHTVLGPISAVVFNLFLAYVVYFVARLVFYVENLRYFSDSISWGHAWELMQGAFMFDTSAIIYTNALWVLLLLLPWHKKENPRFHSFCKWLFIVVNMLALVVNLCDAVYFKYTLRRTTITVFNEFQNENNLVGIFGIEAMRHWYFFIVALVVGFFLWRCYAVPRLTVRKKAVKRYTLVTFLSLLLFAPLCWVGMRGGIFIRPVTVSTANSYCDRPTEAGLVLNTPFAILRTIGKTHFDVPAYFASEQEMTAVFDPIHRPQPTHPFVKKNVVVIILESYGREYVGALNKHLEGGKYKGYTPFTDSLIAQSRTFTHSFCNGRKSIDGMPSILSGIPMFVEPLFVSPYSTNKVSGMADCLNQKGYETAFFHGAERGSMGFMAFARATKFQHYYGREDFEADPRTLGAAEYDNHWGIWDEPFLQYFCTKMDDMKQPFMTTLFTLSSHHPYNIPDKYKEQFPEGPLPIHRCIRYTDHALGRFFERARRSPWFQNTIFVITSDHTHMSNHDEYLTDLGGFCSPIIFYDPSGEIQPGMQDAIAQQIDIMPTILNHLGYDKPYLGFGIDLFNTPASQTFAVNYLNGIYQYVKYGYVLQFDGEKTKAIYALDDRLMKKNLLGKNIPQQQQMELELKAIIQQYMERMVNNRLTPTSPQS